MLFWIIFVGFLFIAIKTNPTEQDFQNFLGQVSPRQGGILNFVQNLITSRNSNFQRRDYGIFSIYKLSDKTYLGCFSKFFIVKEVVGHDVSHEIEEQGDGYVQQANQAKKERDFALAARLHIQAANMFLTAPKNDFILNQAAKNFEQAHSCFKQVGNQDFSFTSLLQAADTYSQVDRLKNKAARCFEELANMSNGKQRLDFYEKALKFYGDDSRAFHCKRFLASTNAMMKNYNQACEMYLSLASEASENTLVYDLEGLAIDALFCKAASLDEIATRNFYQSLLQQYPKLSLRTDVVRWMESWNDLNQLSLETMNLKRRSQESWHILVFDEILNYANQPSIT